MGASAGQKTGMSDESLSVRALKRHRITSTLIAPMSISFRFATSWGFGTFHKFFERLDAEAAQEGVLILHKRERLEHGL